MKILNSFKYIDILKLSTCRGISRTSSRKKQLRLKDAVALGLPSVYNLEQVEIDSMWYEWWESQRFFQPEKQVNSELPYFSMVLPPPNVTGTLHIGHALTNVIQDSIARWCRMNGRQVLWIPGTDHAGIATQSIMEKVLWHEQKKTIHDIGKEKFKEEIWKWKNEKEEIIFSQMKRLGSSLDWEKKAFTMDPCIAEAVTEAFVRLHEKGLIKRHKAFINWCCHLKTTISDVEVQHLDISEPRKINIPGYSNSVDVGWLTHFAYPVHQSKSQQEIVVATTRPETIFGDVAIAVNPADSRYFHFHGGKVRHPFTGRLLPIICDEFVDMNIGTGAVKITPAHDPTDYNVALEHNLNILEVIDETGHLANVPTIFKGLPRFIARQSVLKCLKEMCLLKDQVPHPTVLPLCSRSGDIIEPRLKSQWFVQCKEMSKEAIKAVSDGTLKIIPENYIKNWNDWLSNSQEWCISRQLVWGHRIPAYTAKIKGSQMDEEVWVTGRHHGEALKKASDILATNKENITLMQDEDVLDTWFSSAIFPFAVLGWPKNTLSFRKFYPLSLMETGHDILSFWITRIIMLGHELTGRLPFNKILLHGIICDAQGRKMSKSLGNIIDPLDVINGATLQDLQQRLSNFYASGIITKEEFHKGTNFQRKSFPQGIPACGADALRFFLCSCNIQDHFITLDVNKLNQYRLFCNKIWQATRFILSNTNEMPNKSLNEVSNDLLPMDRWILSRLATLIYKCNEAFLSYNLQHATMSLYEFIYFNFCDTYLEHVKLILRSSDEQKINAAKVVLVTCIQNALLTLSPFMPFLSEELYQQLPVKKPEASICITQYPQSKDWHHWKDKKLETTVKTVLEICKSVRALKSGYGLKYKPKVTIICNDDYLFSLIKEFEPTIFILARCESLKWAITNEQFEPVKFIIYEINSSLGLAIPYEERKEDHEKELARVCKQEMNLKQKLKQFENLGSDRSKRKIQNDNSKKEALIEQVNRTTKIRMAMERFCL